MAGSSIRNDSSSSPIAEASIARDIQIESALDLNDSPANSPPRTAPEHSLSNYYTRPSFVSGTHPTILPAHPHNIHLSQEERDRLIREERSLLKDNNLLIHSASQNHSGSSLTSKVSPSEVQKTRSIPDEEEGLGQPSQTTPLLGRVKNTGEPINNADEVDQKWEDAVLAGLIKTTWQRETKVLARNAAPLILTFLLQYSLTVASIFAIGHLGSMELGAVSLASMTANITGYSVYHGLATSLDTLCAQAYGSGKKHLVGIQLQRMICFLLFVSIPIAIIWYNGGRILEAIVPEKETARLAGLYLRVIICGMPGYLTFESSKRFVQAQGLFDATLYCLLFCAPLNAIMNYTFVWKLKWGFIGAPIAVVITDSLLPCCLFLYVYFIRGRECWGGFSRAAFRNWWPMIKLALPGLVMILAEFLAFEILTLAASYLSGTHLAAQSVLSTIAALTFQLPFPTSIAASTRIANLIGATLAPAAQTAARVAICAAFIIGMFNVSILLATRHIIPKLFTSDEEVAKLVAATLPVTIAFQLFDALATTCNGILRGLGRQDFGGYVNLIAYYLVALPISFGMGFGLHWGLRGLWSGPAIALVLVGIIEGIFILSTSWERSIEDARRRNEMG